MPSMAACERSPVMPEVCLRKMQSHFIGGAQRTVRDLPIQHREVVRNGGERPLDMNGSYAVGQMYAMEYRLAGPRSPLPVLLWPGGGRAGGRGGGQPQGPPGWRGGRLGGEGFAEGGGW